MFLGVFAHQTTLADPEQGKAFRPMAGESSLHPNSIKVKKRGAQKMVKRKLIFVTGVPGMGKTEILSRLCDLLEGVRFYDGADVKGARIQPARLVLDNYSESCPHCLAAVEGVLERGGIVIASSVEVSPSVGVKADLVIDLNKKTSIKSSLKEIMTLLGKSNSLKK